MTTAENTPHEKSVNAEKVLSQNPDLLLACAIGMEELKKRQQGEQEQEERWDWLEDAMTIQFDPLRHFLIELEERAGDDDYAFTLGARMLLESSIKRTSEMVDALESHFGGRIKLYLRKEDPQRHRFARPVQKVEVDQKLFKGKEPPLTTLALLRITKEKMAALGNTTLNELMAQAELEGMRLEAEAGKEASA